MVNRDLWEELDRLASEHHAEWVWTKGHASHEDNNRCDELAQRAAREQRASSAAEALTREGTRVRFGGSIHVPEDEICFFTFEAASGREAELVAQRAGLEPLRVVEALSSTEGDS